MRKLKLFIAACALMVGAGQTWAQTDVTSTYLVNPSFEYSAEGVAYTQTKELAVKQFMDGLELQSVTATRTSR